jgi:hypothetical protein
MNQDGFVTFVDIINVLELIGWPSLGILVARRSLGAAPHWRRLGRFAAIVLILFGLSDAVELYTKTWWKPWWLLAWKAICINVLIGCVIIRIRYKRLRP